MSKNMSILVNVPWALEKDILLSGRMFFKCHLDSVGFVLCPN